MLAADSLQDGAGLDGVDVVDSIMTELKNYSNNQYVGSLYLGSNLEPRDFIFDTGSPWLWVAVKGCQGSCAGPKTFMNTYDPA